jgi:uroporphyrinogen-III decarboxylase
MSAMTSRERMLTALDNGRPDRLPCQVHGWMDYYLRTYLGGCDWYQACERFGMDCAIYVSPRYEYDEKSRDNWRIDKTVGTDADGNRVWHQVIHTPEGDLTEGGASNPYTSWCSEYPIKSERDFELWAKYRPVPIRADLAPVREAREKVGDRGIVRSHPFSAGQGSPWQSFCTLADTEQAIYWAMDKPQFVHHAMETILAQTLRVLEMWEGTPADMVETGGGAASSTVISPAMFREFCLPYDRRQHRRFAELGVKVVYHLCGGLMPMLEMVVENGADGLETMTPPNMGGDCDLAEASRRVGEKLFFIGGFDQNAGFEKGTPEAARRLVRECFEATEDHAGYIVAPSDHFFFGDPANVQAFVDEARNCAY